MAPAGRTRHLAPRPAATRSRCDREFALRPQIAVQPGNRARRCKADPPIGQSAKRSNPSRGGKRLHRGRGAYPDARPGAPSRRRARRGDRAPGKQGLRPTEHVPSGATTPAAGESANPDKQKGAGCPCALFHSPALAPMGQPQTGCDPASREAGAGLAAKAYFAPSRSMRLRSILRARRTAAAFSRARFSDGFSK